MPPDGEMNQVKITGVFLPLIFWCLKMGENGGSVRPHMVGFNTDVKFLIQIGVLASPDKQTPYHPTELLGSETPLQYHL